MRITGGRAAGIPIRIPNLKTDIRPATDRMRQAVFSHLAPIIEGSRFLDLFAGSGSYGLECLSRNAANGVFVEKNRKATEAIRTNLAAVCKSLGVNNNTCSIHCTDATVWKPLEDNNVPFDLILIDPPYEIIPKVQQKLFQLAKNLISESPNARLLFEMPADLDLQPPEWNLVKYIGPKNKKSEPSVRIYTPQPPLVPISQ